MKTCVVCGDNLGPVNDGQDVCLGCHIDGLLPRSYQRRERYEYVPAFGHHNATCRPPTGIPWLDVYPLRISDLRLTHQQVSELRHAEAKAM
jgi:hypothetical protein